MVRVEPPKKQPAVVEKPKEVIIIFVLVLLVEVIYFRLKNTNSYFSRLDDVDKQSHLLFECKVLFILIVLFCRSIISMM